MLRKRLILTSPIVLTLAIVWISLAAKAPIMQQQTFIGPTYTVPPGVILRVEKPFKITDEETPCDNWPNTPTVLPCYIEIQAVATDNQGAQAWAMQKWNLEAAPTPTPTPTPTPKPPKPCNRPPGRGGGRKCDA